jgi:hypothetical protein
MRVSVSENFKIWRWIGFLFFRIKKSSGGGAATGQRAFNKLARTFAAQVETLKRYWCRGEQTMPRALLHYEAASTTPPPTAMGLPRSDGSSSARLMHKRHRDPHAGWWLLFPS